MRRANGQEPISGETASAIPGVRIFEDHEAVVAKSFGGVHFGSDASLRLYRAPTVQGRYHGLPGHSGDNGGRSVITALLRGEAPAQISVPIVTPVFGCSLRGE